MKLFCDTANFADIKEAAKNPNISGFTTNPTLMKQAGITDYKDYAIRVIEYLKDNRPDTCLSLEVFADEPDELYRQACVVNEWANEFKYSVYIKVPIMNSKAKYNTKVIKKLTRDGIQVNVTAVMSGYQGVEILESLEPKIKSIISVFAGRIADTGMNPYHIINNIKLLTWDHPRNELLWASTREIYSYQEASRTCDIITMGPDQIKKMELLKDKNLDTYSLETCKMFYDDAIKCGFKIE